jgi:hypothetical protein
VIPLIPAHDFYLKSLIAYLAQNQSFIHEVIISRSETSSLGGKWFVWKLRRVAAKAGYVSPLKFTFDREVCFDGKNRNRGVAKASGEYAMFLDADDKYSRNRFNHVYEAILREQPDAVLHSYSLQRNPDESPVWDTPDSKMQRLSLRNGEILGVDNYSEATWASAHLVVRRQILESETYLDIWPGSDSEFVLRLVRKDFNVLYLAMELSNWNRRRTARYVLRRIRILLGQQFR